jgi:hypothetical protein
VAWLNKERKNGKEQRKTRKETENSERQLERDSETKVEKK